MPVNLAPVVKESLLEVPGVKVGVAEAGIRKANRRDLTVFVLEPGSALAGVFTENRFCAAPVQVCRSHLAQGSAIRALAINTGNANAGTGEQGLAAANQTCAELAKLLACTAHEILPFSTGVIMEQLPLARVLAGLPTALADARSDAWFDAAHAIMTTDTVPKARSARVRVGAHEVVVTGISKGAGMIRPNMATMLGFMATDARIDPALMPALARELADASFNRITIDGDTSTNDSFIVMATQQSAMPVISSLHSAEGQQLKAGLLAVAQYLAHAIVRDGEGATKFLTIRVQGGRERAECLRAAYAIAHSPLVKTAFFASDPNLGRILAAVGYAGIADLDQSRIEMHLDDVHVVTQGGRHPAYREEDGQRVMKQSEITIQIDLGRGDVADTVWTCDLSHDYVSINADYRS